MAIIAEQSGIDVTAINTTQHLCDALCFDSLEIIELFVEIEDQLEIAFTPDEDAEITTVGDLLAVVDRHTGDQP